MNNYTLIEIGLFAVLGITSVFSIVQFFLKMRGQMTRQLLFPFVGQLVTWTLFGVFFFSGLIAVFYFAAIAAIYIPTIILILRLPKDDNVA